MSLSKTAQLKKTIKAIKLAKARVAQDLKKIKAAEAYVRKVAIDDDVKFSEEEHDKAARDSILRDLGYLGVHKGYQVNLIKDKKCPLCSESINESDFRGGLDRIEYKISGACQKCQDKFFSEDEDE